MKPAELQALANAMLEALRAIPGVNGAVVMLSAKVDGSTAGWATVGSWEPMALAALALTVDDLAQMVGEQVQAAGMGEPVRKADNDGGPI